jgi:hypothetical protein
MGNESAPRKTPTAAAKKILELDIFIGRVLLAVAAIGINSSRLWTRQVRERRWLIFEPSRVGNPVVAGLVLSESPEMFGIANTRSKWMAPRAISQP